MPATTPNYAIPYPLITDFVKDGATDMEAIAEKVDDILSTGAAARNLLYNGAMQVAQRGAGPVTGLTTSEYRTADRWQEQIVTQGTWTNSIETDAPTGSGFRKSLKMLCTAIDASPTGNDEVCVDQRLEGQDLQMIRKGTSSAQQLTLSFWVKANLTGTYVAMLYDLDNARFCSKSYTINSSATWEYKTLTFPADTTGAFDNDSNASLLVRFYLGAGTNFTSGTLQTTWGTDTTANRCPGQANLAATVNNYWQTTGAQLTVGTVAVPFEFKTYGQELNECMRFYQVWSNSSNTNFMTIGSSIYSTPMSLAVPMRAIRATSTAFVAAIYGQSSSYALNSLGVTILEASRPQYFTLTGTFSSGWNYSWPLCTFNTHTCIFDGEL